jgi:hypothetical protein
MCRAFSRPKPWRPALLKHTQADPLTEEEEGEEEGGEEEEGEEEGGGGVGGGEKEEEEVWWQVLPVQGWTVLLLVLLEIEALLEMRNYWSF